MSNLPVGEVGPVSDGVARHLVPEMPPPVHQRVVRVLQSEDFNRQYFYFGQIVIFGGMVNLHLKSLPIALVPAHHTLLPTSSEAINLVNFCGNEPTWWVTKCVARSAQPLGLLWMEACQLSIIILTTIFCAHLQSSLATYCCARWACRKAHRSTGLKPEHD